MNPRQQPVTLVFLFSVLIVLAIVIVVARKPQTSLPAAEANVAQIALAPSQKPPEDVLSPSEKLKFRIQSTKNKDKTTTYSFAITDAGGAVLRTIYTRTVNEGSTMSIPQNSWSIDDEYAFIEENTPDASKYFVLKTNGENFLNGEKYLDVGELLTKNRPELRIRQATGWVEGATLIVYTFNTDGSKGPHFWFVVPTQGFLQLAD